ncbi:hypothetical protein ACFZCY_18930 [Streptomyces sp. NPDC007983]
MPGAFAAGTSSPSRTASMAPLFPYLTLDVTPLAQHPSDLAAGKLAA